MEFLTSLSSDAAVLSAPIATLAEWLVPFVNVIDSLLGLAELSA